MPVDDVPKVVFEAVSGRLETATADVVAHFSYADRNADQHRGPRQRFEVRGVASGRETIADGAADQSRNLNLRERAMKDIASDRDQMPLCVLMTGHTRASQLFVLSGSIVARGGA